VVFKRKNVDRFFAVTMPGVLEVGFPELVKVVESVRKEEFSAEQVEAGAKKADQEKGAEDFFAGQSGGLQGNQLSPEIHREKDLQGGDEKGQRHKENGALDKLKPIIGGNMGNLDPFVDKEILHMQGIVDEGVEKKEAAEKKEENSGCLAQNIAFP
jgi:hypothetical protein